MIVDDNRHDNFFHQRVIEKADAAARVIVYLKAVDAVNHLKSTAAGAPGYPNLILLDINMPGMNGWDFIDEFRTLEKEKQQVVIVMLTTSVNPDDELKAKKSGSVADFRSKPLVKAMLDDILNKFF
jgi:CheY-like chemotaxis protein